MTNLVFAHGWGSGDFVWDEMLPAFAEHDVHTINMGFVGAENINMPDGKFIGIGHSLGGLWLLKHYPEQMIGFVSIASFNCFYKHIRSQILTMMRANMVKDSAKQLQDFWHHAGLDQPQGFKNIHPTKLIEGLTWLAQWSAEIPNIPVMALGAKDDHIVPMRMTQDIWGTYDLKWTEDGGHILPLTRAEWCIDHVEEFIKKING